MCPPADSSLGGYGILPYPRHLLWDILPQDTPNSQNLLLRCPPTDFSLGGYGILPYPRHLLWDILPQNTPNSQNLLLRCPPTDFSLGGYGILPYPRHLLCPPTEYAEFTEPPAEMSSHGFHRFTQILRVRCSPTEFTEYTEFGSVGMAGMPYPPTSVLICVIRGRLFSARSSVRSVRSVGISFLPRISQIYTDT